MSNKLRNGHVAAGSRAAIEAFASPSELRGAHNFATAAQPILNLELVTAPPPLGPNQQGRAQRSRAVAPADTDFQIESRLADDDLPFQPPASWHKPLTPEPAGHRWHWSERSIAAFLGFAAGILIIVPAVLMIDPGPQQSRSVKPAQERQLAQVDQASAIVKKTGIGAGNWVDSKPAQTQTLAEEADAAEAVDAEAIARKALGEGRLSDARNILRAAASSDNPHLWLLLAESYDPNRPLAAEIRRGSEPQSELTATDIQFARFYYQQALIYGVSGASRRLAALPRPNSR